MRARARLSHHNHQSNTASHRRSGLTHALTLRWTKCKCSVPQWLSSLNQFFHSDSALRRRGACPQEDQALFGVFCVLIKLCDVSRTRARPGLLLRSPGVEPAFSLTTNRQSDTPDRSSCIRHVLHATSMNEHSCRCSEAQQTLCPRRVSERSKMQNEEPSDATTRTYAHRAAVVLARSPAARTQRTTNNVRFHHVPD